MKLTKVHVTEFRSVIDSNEFTVDDITCLVGKNEAGKTAILKALYGLNPLIESDGEFDVTDDYPRREVEDYKQDVESKKRSPANVVTATFQLNENEVALVIEEFGEGSLNSSELTFSNGYANKSFGLSINNGVASKHIITNSSLPQSLQNKLLKLVTPTEFLAVLDDAEESSEVTRLKETFTKIKERGFNGFAYDKHLKSSIPKFLYFDEYYQMNGFENIEALQQREKSDSLKASDHPLLGLIKLARLMLDSLINPDRTQELKNKLEGAGNHLTKQVIKYWSQNKHIQMRFDVRPARPNDPVGMQSGTNIWADIYDSRHMVTTSVGTRSRGFVWFFSFLAWYSQVKKENDTVILLLDEPGLSLHAKAQEDLLRYFEEEVKGNNQLIYSTHSPFMIDARHFERVRIVQDSGIDKDSVLPEGEDGTKVLTDIFEASSDSLFPLQGALGYEIYQTLFVGPNNLVVEGASDLIYLQIISSVLESKKREGLDKRWTITPVGGGDKVPTFVALLGNQQGLKIATLIDIQNKDRQTIENLYKKKLLDKQNVLTFADFTGTNEADIEDMFDPDFYIKLVNAEFKTNLSRTVSKTSLTSKHPRILRRIAEFLVAHPLKQNVNFSHLRPARYLSENIAVLASELSDDSLKRFENAFRHLNNLL